MPMQQIPWSPSEKKVARAAFDHALDQELAECVAEFKAKAAEATSTDDLWAIRDYLYRRQKEIERVFEQLLWVFAGLLLEGRITKQQLAGRSEEKLASSRRLSTL